MRSAISSAASESGSTCRCAANCTTGTSVSPARPTACSARPCARSRGSGGIPARRCAPRRWPARRRLRWKPGVPPSRGASRTSRRSETGVCSRQTPTVLRSRKRTKPGFTWISAARGARAGGLAYVGTPQGGVAFGIRNFWQSHPSELAIAGAAGETAEATAWLWSPRAGAMDLRGYHDEMGEDTYAKQLEALEITYEDYEPGYDRPEGVARTSEMMLWALPATPPREQLARFGRPGAHAARARARAGVSARRARSSADSRRPPIARRPRARRSRTGSTGFSAPTRASARNGAGTASGTTAT